MAKSASALGQQLAENNIRLVYGGGKVGLMGIVATATLAAGGNVVGVLPKHLAIKELIMDGLTELHVVGSMHERKRMMFELSDAFVSLPGGVGTLDETIELVVWRQLALHDKPIILANIDNYWAPFEAMLAHFTDEGFGSTHDLRLFVLVDNIDDIIPALRRAPSQEIPGSPELI